MTAAKIAWIVTFLCVLFSARIATAFLRHNPRMFTVMALFACVWTLVQGVYRDPDETDLGNLISNLAAFLLIYIGGLLKLEASSTDDHEINTVPLQTIGLIFLLFIAAAPKELSLPLPDGTSFGLNKDQTGAVIGLLFDVIASISVVFGAKGISNRPLFVLLVFALGGYVLMDLQRAYYQLITNTSQQLSTFQYLAYAFLKVYFTVTFGCIIAHHGMTDGDRKKGRRYWILHYFGLAGLPMIKTTKS